MSKNTIMSQSKPETEQILNDYSDLVFQELNELCEEISGKYDEAVDSVILLPVKEQIKTLEETEKKALERIESFRSKLTEKGAKLRKNLETANRQMEENHIKPLENR